MKEQHSCTVDLIYYPLSISQLNKLSQAFKAGPKINTRQMRVKIGVGKYMKWCQLPGGPVTFL